MTRWLEKHNIAPYDPSMLRHAEVATRPAEELFETGRKVLPELARIAVPRVLKELADDPEKYRELYGVTYQPFGDQEQGRGMEIRVGNLSNNTESYRVRIGLWPEDENEELRLYQGRRSGWMPDHGYGDGAAHSHGYPIASLPVLGAQKDKVISLQEVGSLSKDIEVTGDQFRVFTLDSHGVPGQSDHLINKDGKAVRVAAVEDRMIPSGQLYTMPAENDFAHAVTNHKNDLALTVSLNGNRTKGEQTIVYFQGDGAPISDERFTPSIDSLGKAALQMVRYLEKTQ